MIFHAPYCKVLPFQALALPRKDLPRKVQRRKALAQILSLPTLDPSMYLSNVNLKERHLLYKTVKNKKNHLLAQSILEELELQPTFEQ